MHPALLLFLLAVSSTARPFPTGREVFESPSSLKLFAEHLIYWFRGSGWFHTAPSTRHDGTHGVDAERPGAPVNEGTHFPFGIGSPLNGWGWGENELSVVVRLASFPLEMHLSNK